MAHEIGGDALVDVLVEDTQTCYLGDRSRRHDWGFGGPARPGHGGLPKRCAHECGPL
jgi:hypothetical protein